MYSEGSVPTVAIGGLAALHRSLAVGWLDGEIASRSICRTAPAAITERVAGAYLTFCGIDRLLGNGQLQMVAER